MKRSRKSTEGYKAKYGYRCMTCGQPGNNVHHLIPLHKGGPDDSEFWVLLCEKCHRMKGLHSDQRYYVELATKKFYAESLKEPKNEIFAEAFIIGPQRTINLIHSRNRTNPKSSIEEELEASTRIGIINQRLKFPMLNFQNMKALRHRLNRTIKNDPYTFSDIFNVLANEVSKKGG